MCIMTLREEEKKKKKRVRALNERYYCKLDK